MALLAATSSLASCNRQEGESGGQPLRITSASAGITTTVTRAYGIRELTEATDAIGIFLQAGNGYDAINNSKYSYWTPYWITSGEYLILGVNAGSLAAYYPYDEYQATPIATLLTRAYRPEREFYYQTFSASYMTPAVRLSLKRAYALIRFSIVRGEADQPLPGGGAYQGDGKVTAFGCTASLAESGTLDLFTDVLTPGTPKSVTLRTESPEVPFSIGSKDSPAAADFLIVPHSAYNGTLNFTATIDGKTMSGSVGSAALCGVTGALNAGVMYEIKVIVRPTALVVSGISQKQWDVTDVGGELEIK